MIETTNKNKEVRSEMSMVENAIAELCQQIAEVKRKAAEVERCIVDGNKQSTIEKNVLASVARVSGGTRFEEMRQQVREDCRSMVSAIDNTLSNILAMVKAD